MNRPQSFAIWVTGLPASGKSTIVSALKPQLEAMGLAVEVLESDEVRRVITPMPTYSEAERDLFYRALAFTGQRLAAHGVTVVFDATASRRVYRDFARSVIPRFIEVAVECPLTTCMERDRKGTYRKGQRGDSLTVPGLQSPYEAPINPDLRIDTTTTPSSDAARQICELVKAKFF
ncbi:MAG: adenylyl-sulfate kinase [Nitrospirae bacterium]|nr:adenylyl-sulfate kinase [Nitrospirota bacterium]MDE3041161.1 adenylyl-sulfate kinase [Nitrospirota bacterium]